jgi:hypothetical protein
VASLPPAAALLLDLSMALLLDLSMALLLDLSTALLLDLSTDLLLLRLSRCGGGLLTALLSLTKLVAWILTIPHL